MTYDEAIKELREGPLSILSEKALDRLILIIGQVTESAYRRGYSAAIAEDAARSPAGKAMHRDMWISAQTRLAEIEDRLNAITGEQCGIFENLDLIKARWADRKESK